jgi:ubiquinone/menaquinone biosynthesis C-methylase UbiE
MNQKALWNKLAKENAMYYINSDYGKGITDDEFRYSGRRDVNMLVWKDILLKKDCIILELGGGNGRMSEYLGDIYTKVYALDISGEMIKQGKERLDDMPQIEFIETDGMTIPLKDNLVDVAFSYLVFQHFKTKEMVESNFREVYRVLKPKGIFKVRVRTDKIDSMNKWWAGVSCDETYPLSIGFKLLKKQSVENYGLWLWLEKP